MQQLFLLGPRHVCAMRTQTNFTNPKSSSSPKHYHLPFLITGFISAILILLWKTFSGSLKHFIQPANHLQICHREKNQSKQVKIQLRLIAKSSKISTTTHDLNLKTTASRTNQWTCQNRNENNEDDKQAWLRNLDLIALHIWYSHLQQSADWT